MNDHPGWVRSNNVLTTLADDAEASAKDGAKEVAAERMAGANGLVDAFAAAAGKGGGGGGS